MILTLQDFIKDYQHLVIRYENKMLRDGFTNVLIGRFYRHIEDDCYSWLKSNK